MTDNGHSSCFPFLALTNNAAVNIHVYVFGGAHRYASLVCVYMGVCVMPGSSDVTMFAFSKYRQRVFQYGHFNL